MVLNSLTSPGMLAASLAVLKRGGTFVEVGKRDIWAAARVAQVRRRVQLCWGRATEQRAGACTHTCTALASVLFRWPTRGVRRSLLDSAGAARRAVPHFSC